MIWSSRRRRRRGLDLRRHLHGVAHLEQRHGDHEDDQQHQHHVDQRRDVDVAPDSSRIAHVHCHGLDSSGRPRLSGAARLLLLGDEADAAEAGLVDQSASPRAPALYFSRLSALMTTSLSGFVAWTSASVAFRFSFGTQFCPTKTLPSDLTAIVSCFCVLGHLRPGSAVSGSVDVHAPAGASGVTTMKMISSTRHTSTRGVTLMSPRTSLTRLGLSVPRQHACSSAAS